MREKSRMLETNFYSKSFPEDRAPRQIELEEKWELFRVLAYSKGPYFLAYYLTYHGVENYDVLNILLLEYEDKFQMYELVSYVNLARENLEDQLYERENSTIDILNQEFGEIVNFVKKTAQDIIQVKFKSERKLKKLKDLREEVVKVKQNFNEILNKVIERIKKLELEAKRVRNLKMNRENDFNLTEQDNEQLLKEAIEIEQRKFGTINIH